MQQSIENEINSYCGVGKIQFGMNESQIYDICENKLEKRVSKYSDEYELYWDDRGIDIVCNKEGKCVAIEGNILSKITYLGVELVGKPYIEVKNYLLQFGKEIVEDECGCTIYDLGIGLYVPTLKAGEEEEVEGVIAFLRGYYE